MQCDQLKRIAQSSPFQRRREYRSVLFAPLRKLNYFLNQCLSADAKRGVQAMSRHFNTFSHHTFNLSTNSFTSSIDCAGRSFLFNSFRRFVNWFKLTEIETTRDRSDWSGGLYLKNKLSDKGSKKHTLLPITPNVFWFITQLHIIPASASLRWRG